MTDFSAIDPNFKVEPAFSQDGLVFYDVTKPPFSLHGLLHEDGCFRRLPRRVAEAVSKEVAHLSLHTAGGRVRFVTDSKRIAIRAAMHAIEKMPHFALTGSGGFDLFEEADYLATFIPPFGFLDGFSSQKVLDSRKERLLTVNFPLYSGVRELYIGIEERAALQPAPAYSEAPVVFYGSSITQGGCASKPGCAFPAMVGQMLGIDHINLGFSGSCKGESAMADWLASLPMRAFVCGSVTGFGGISVFMQSADALCACGVSMKKYFLGKITQALLCGCFCAVAKWFRVGVNAWVLFGEQEGKIRGCF